MTRRLAAGHKHDRFTLNLMKICLLPRSQTLMPSIPIATRAQIVTLKALGYANEEICSKLYLATTHRSINRIYKRALDRGFNPEKPTCFNHHVDDAPRSG